MPLQTDPVVLTSLEIIISLLVFGIGIPALIFDRPQWLRRIRDSHSIWSWYPTLAAFILSIAVLILTSFFISTPRVFGCFGHSSILSDVVCPFIYWAMDHPQTISGYLIIISSITTLGLWWRLRSYRTVYVVRKVGDIALGRSWRQRIAQRPLFHFVDVAFSEKEICIRDLGDIGRTVEIDDDRRSVLEMLGKLLDGDHLFDTKDTERKLLRAYVNAIIKATSKDVVSIQKLAINIMNTLMTEAIAKNDISIQIVSSYLKRLGSHVISLEHDELDIALLESVQSGTTIRHAELLFDWSILALSLGRNATAIKFIDKLQVQTEDILPEDASTGLHLIQSPEIAFLFVGLIAHFCSTNGVEVSQTRREVGRKRFNETFHGFEPAIDSLFDRGVEYFTLLRSDYVTVDRINELRADFNIR